MVEVKEFKRTLDPVTFEVLRGGFSYIPDRMYNTLQRMSFTTIIYEIADFSVSIYDPETNLIGQDAGCPIHLGAMSFSTRACVEKFPHMKKGDAAILNDPYAGGTHTPDVTVVAPMYYGDKLAGYSCARAHWIDMGGGGIGSQAWGTHIATEGFRLFPMLIAKEGKLNEDLVNIIKNQVRMPDRVEGDIMAQIGTTNIAEREMVGLINRFDYDTVRLGMREIVAYTEYRFRRKIAELPDGEYEAETFTESDGVTGAKVGIRLKIVIKGGHLTVDFTGTDPLVDGAINSPLANTCGAVLYSLLGMLAPDLPLNEGLYRAVEIKVPDGCFLKATWPHPVIGSTTHTATKIATTVWMALNKVVPPEKRIGVTYSECNWWCAAVLDPKTGLPSLMSDLPSGGWGATAEHDGMNACNDPHIVNALLMSGEVAEQAHPVYWQQYEIRTDSAGPGKYRGGAGMIFKFKPLANAEISMESSWTKIGVPGTMGGGRGMIQYVIREEPDGTLHTVMGRDLQEDTEERWHRSLQPNMPFPEGTTFVLLTGGGGGYGDPLERDKGKVREDVLDDYVSIEGAKRDYGVIINAETLEVDHEATVELREKLSKSKDYREYIQGPRRDYIPLWDIIKNRNA